MMEILSQDGLQQPQQPAGTAGQAEQATREDAQRCQLDEPMASTLAHELEQERQLVQVLSTELGEMHTLNCSLRQQLQHKENQLQETDKVSSCRELSPGTQMVAAETVTFCIETLCFALNLARTLSSGALKHTTVRGCAVLQNLHADARCSAPACSSSPAPINNSAAFRVKACSCTTRSMPMQ
jgi:hypothetical protein